MLRVAKVEGTPSAEAPDELARMLAEEVDGLASRANAASLDAYARRVARAAACRTVIPRRGMSFEGAERAVSDMCDMAVFKVESLRDAAKVERAVAQGMAESALGFVAAVRSGAFDSDAAMLEAAEEARRAMEGMARGQAAM